ncbi:putative C2H2 type zinc finger domain-containing protein [Penicillium digitatum]|uniref:Putative C2H2 type zinc finger domain-containing protein n=1 Tax=Penicillium digitatum TaxID=36651 RepID=A0A7T6XT17_PENDI|nr:putative C2H2 type zinc finger domain-containing protein [Penicillium digitatum]
MSLDFDPFYLFELSQEQHNSGDLWTPGELWPLEEVVDLNDFNNRVDPSLQLDPNFDFLWSQLNGSLSSVDGSLEQPLSSPTSLSSSTHQSQADSKPWTPPDIFEIGYQDENGDWRCNYSGCLSRQVFLRACDLRKHYRSHQKTYFCKERDCAWSKIGFSSSKDCQRHMRSHRPMIKCSAAESLGCTRVFSRVDNMKEHHRKIHEFSQNNLFPRPCRRSHKRKDSLDKPPELDSTAGPS